MPSYHSFADFKKSEHATYLGTDLDTLVEKDFSEFQAQKEKDAADAKAKTSVTTEEVADDGATVTTTTTIVTTETKQVVVKTPAKKPAPAPSPTDGLVGVVAPTAGPSEDGVTTPPADDSITPIMVTVEGGKVTVPYDDTNHVTIGLRVYTNKDVPASVVGRLRSGEGSVNAKESLEVKTVAVST